MPSKFIQKIKRFGMNLKTANQTLLFNMIMWYATKYYKYYSGQKTLTKYFANNAFVNWVNMFLLTITSLELWQDNLLNLVPSPNARSL